MALPLFLFKFKKRFIRPYRTGWMPVQDGHEIYFQELGNPNGEPVIVFHGGPGGSAKSQHACLYNLKRQHVILFDQRGCGLLKSQDPIYKNTTTQTIKDAARLLDFLGIQSKIVVAGGSWGSTLALVFAQTYPQRVKSLQLYSIFLGRPQDVENMTPIAKYFYPDAIEEVKKQAGNKPLNDYYCKLLSSSKRADNEKAIWFYRRLERLTGGASLTVNFPKTPVSDRDIRKFRIFMTYLSHKMFLAPNQILKNTSKITHIPTEIYQNRLDFCCPPEQAWALHKALPRATFHLIPDKGHGSDLLFYTIYRNNLKKG